jgi:hypothetical protein
VFRSLLTAGSSNTRAASRRQARRLLEHLQLAFQLAKGVIQTFNEIVAGHSTHLSYNILFGF